ncbi:MULTISPECIES: terminase large subunit domain-containing protein [unclassified Aeromicrobium]|uniref:terminase large subunit domain-containing protein n=1 Tax=unclassified Aeromicrobium TaxID=2633570 RepID=UPI00288C515D|nr:MULTISPECIES: terminase large subunit [unclassified Aeromicrobium]
MSVLAPEFTEREAVPIGDWHPTRFTPSLSGDETFPSAGDRLLAAVDAGYFRAAGVARFTLDPWQRWLIRHVLEKYPDDWPDERLRGQLRFRQVVISMGRQNGKSLIAALFAMWALTMHVGGPSVVGFASSEKQAKIVYKRLGYAVRRSPELRRLLKYTLTQGITRHDGSGEYITIPADEDAAQGIPITFGLGDELHIIPPGLWAAIVNGQRAQASSILVGITTAGDEDSALLLSLYGQVDAAIDGKHERLGGFIWEAPEDARLDDPAAVIAANPSVACGRIDLSQVLADAALQPEPDQRRYLHNRFISSTNAWLPTHLWSDAPEDRVTPGTSGVVFTVERAPDWSHGNITVTVKRDDGTLATQLLRQIVKPNHTRLLQACEDLSVGHPDATFAMDGLNLKSVATALKAKGATVVTLTGADVVTAHSTAYALIAAGKVAHAHDPLLALQNRGARRKNVGEGWRLSAEDSTTHIDAVRAMIFGLYVADTTEPIGLQVF